MSNQTAEANQAASGVLTTGSNVGPTEKIRKGIRDHLVPINNLILIATSLISLLGCLDFLTAYTVVVSRTLYTAAGLGAFVLIVSAFWPGTVDRMLKAIGLHVARIDSMPLWKRPVWRVTLVVLLISAVFGVASLAKANEGGLMASHSKTIRSWQEELFQLRQDMAEVKAGVEAANGKLDTLVENSKDPQKDLIARGYTFNDSGLMQALKQADAHAVGLFVKAHYVANYEGPMAIILNGDQPWNGDVVALLPKSMFFAKTTCNEGVLLNYPVKPPAEERIAAFKRLCDPAPWVEMLKKNIADDQLTPAPNDRWKQMRAARKSNLAVLMQ